MDYRRTAFIVAAVPSAVAPEQGAVWAYPLEEAENEEVIMNMVNALLGRIHLSGQLVGQTPQGLALIDEAITLYKIELRPKIKRGIPFWPLGLPSLEAGWGSLGLICQVEDNTEYTTGFPKTIVYLLIWRFGGNSQHCSVPLTQFKLQNQVVYVTCLYPGEDKSQQVSWNWQNASHHLEISFSQPYMARLFKIHWEFNPC